MLTDLIDFGRMPQGENRMKFRALSAVIDLLRRKLGVSIGYDARRLPFEDPRLIDAVALGEKLRAHRIIKSFGPVRSTLADEPAFHWWSAACDVSSDQTVSGASFESDEKALMAALAEGLERYLWLSVSDYFIDPTYATEAGVAKKGACIGAKRWTAFTDEQRAQSKERVLRADASYLWVRALSLTANAARYVPAQIVSGRSAMRTKDGVIEPVIRSPITNGLATWPTQAGARLAGALELIEREAYMIMWLNQLSLPRIDLDELAKRAPELRRILDDCARYRFTVHAVRLITDAPTHAVCIVLEDTSAIAPRYAVGLNAHRSPVHAVQKAITEALRARTAYRMDFVHSTTWNPDTPVLDIGHRDRLMYSAEHPEGLAFMTRGKIEVLEEAAWEHDSEEEHLARFLAWCKEEHLECVSVSLGVSKKNPTPLYVEMVAMPEVQPTYLRESERMFGGQRIRTVPEKFGYAPRPQLFTDRPHPFS